MSLDLCGFASKPVLGNRIVKGEIDELVRLARAAVLDKSLEPHDAESICAWLESNSANLAVSPGDLLFHRLCSMLVDEVLGADESSDLIGLIAALAGQKRESARAGHVSLPLTSSASPVVYPGRSFCFAGVFEFGCRAECHEAVIASGGEPVKRVTDELDYLIVGSVGSAFWREASFGSKISTASRLRDEGASVAIISEQYWVSGLG